MRSDITNIPELKICLDDSAKERIIANPTVCRSHYYDWMPPPKKDIKLTPVARTSVPMPITLCYSWSFHLADKRTKKLINKSNQATGVVWRCHVIGDARVSAAQTCHPNVVPEGGLTSDDAALAGGTSSAALPAEGVEAHAVPDVVAGQGGAVDGEDALDIDPEVDSVIPVATKKHEGWKISYALKQPHHESSDQCMRRLSPFHSPSPAEFSPPIADH